MPRKGTKPAFSKESSIRDGGPAKPIQAPGIDLQMCLRGFAAQELFRPEPVVGILSVLAATL